jgi:glutamate synthase domain-containing protein 2/glutamate synthase domain-containing protein 1/glutamate synthase domain-containing protein 3
MPDAAFIEEIKDACGVGFLADVHGRKGRHILPLALGALGRLAHRGAVDADGRTGDGAGVLTQIPWAILRPELEALGLPCGGANVAIGLVFLPRRETAAACARRLLATSLAAHGLVLAGWRAVPIDEDALGEKARGCRPDFAHAIVTQHRSLDPAEFERRLFSARKEAQARAAAYGLDGFYIASLSHRTIVYKALVRAVDLADFYPDLRQPEFETAFALFHQRFSTNTLPSWSMTQPFRLLAHNGEINTISGNRSWMRARGQQLSSGTSDSASLDEALSLLAIAGRGLTHGMTMLMPPAWENDGDLDEQKRSMFEYQSLLVEPWDGPAFVVFADGNIVGAALDRNGLRPARYLLTTDGLALVASEAGVLDIDERQVLRRGRLGPGEIVAVDLNAGQFLDTNAIRSALAARHPYGQWIEEQRVMLRDPSPAAPRHPLPRERVTLRAFGITRDELQLILGPMYKEGAEPLGSMGDDTPLAVLSSRKPLLFSYFKQRFAQVTNPPIDPYRESMVMSLDTRLGPAGDLLADAPLPAPYVVLPDPLVDSEDVEALQLAGWSARRLALLFPAEGSLELALEQLLAEAAHAVRAGATCLIVSDRGVDAEQAAIPSLLAVSAIHQHLVREGLRTSTSLVADTGEARDDHHIATLLGFGADAVCPWLALELAETDEARSRYRRAVSKGLLKIMSKMGVSTMRSYRGAQLFEAIGIDDDVIARHFTGTPSFIGGIGLEEIARDVLDRHAAAFASGATALEDSGVFRYRQNGEAHAYEPRVVKALHKAIGSGVSLDYRSYADLVHAREPLALRDLLEFRTATPIPIGDVEPVSAIVRRFMTAAMSLGALSAEVQQVLATAMNRLGARSNTGEGGEPAEHFWRHRHLNHRIKQVASARFGVTAGYLVAADELQIKIGQGSKPGEGGQLPGHKVTAEIALVRHATPGTTLISPPPHHDIYSIEDLAQLIYDLKRVNPLATVSVKLVSSAGIGTIAVGVAKAHADAIEISGHDGGTGASPLGSIKNAGTPWELGLSEVQQALVRGGLRGRVRLQVNGGLKTGRDVVMAALLGGEEFGFGTAALVAAGCVMARQCHLNTCPAGIATQREDLRRKFKGTPENVVRFFTAIAEEVREILALLGCRSLEEIIGRSDRLEPRLPSSGNASRLRLDRILAFDPHQTQPRRCMEPHNDPPHTGQRLDERVIRRLRITPAGLAPTEMSLPITNADRAVGARIAGNLTRRLRGAAIAPDTLRLHFRGSAGQSFGAFCIEGMRLVLEGEANDYLGKGMSGGEIVVCGTGFSPSPQVIAGNTLLYGATGGRVFIAGHTGERFAVRNSGALAVVEGTGDHPCEYMTAGVVVILGPTGRNLGAGMSGGIVFALDIEGVRVNSEWVSADGDLSRIEEAWLQQILEIHVEKTGSDYAQALLDDWMTTRLLFRRVLPRSMTAVPQLLPPHSSLERIHHRQSRKAAEIVISGDERPASLER